MKHLRAVAIIASGLADCAVIIGAGCLWVVVIALTDAEPQAELEPEEQPEPEPSPWAWSEVRQQSLSRATKDVTDVLALREASDSAAVLLLLARPL